MTNLDEGPHRKNVLPYRGSLVISRNPDDDMNQIRIRESYPLYLDAGIECELLS